MKMKKAVVAAGLAVLLGAGTASAAPNAGKVGLGYQGVVAGNFLQGVSGRYWVNDTIAGELNVFYGTAGLALGGSDIGDADLLLGTAKVLYAPVVKSNSRFYVGLEGGLGTADVQDDTGSSILAGDITVWTLEPLFGAEFYLSEIPELGFNFEVGYKFHHIGYDVASSDVLDINLDGTTVAFGAHYYF